MKNTILKKRVLIHSNLKPESHGGIEFVVSKLIDILVELKFDVTCFCGDTCRSENVVTQRCVMIVRRVIAKIGGAPILNWGNYLFFVKSKKMDLIVFQEPYPMLWPAIFMIKIIRRIPIIVLVHANPESNNLIKTIYNIIRKIVFSGTNCVVTSPFLLSSHETESFSSFSVIPLGIPNQEPPLNRIKYLPVKYALYIGRLASYKGIADLLEAIKYSNHIKYVVAGSGTMSQFINKQIAEFGCENLLFINKTLTENEKLELINRAEYLIFPSTSKNEAFGIVQLEAMRFGKPIINTWLNSGVNFVAPNRVCALTVPPKNPKELYRAIMKLWNDRKLCKSLGIMGQRRFTSNFLLDRFADNWKSLIAEVVSRKSQ